jgi:ribosomal protein S12 methylthiotransferase accessory factor YcaO
MSKIQDKPSLYQEGHNMASFTQAQGHSSQDANTRALLEMIQRVGADQVQKLLSQTQGLVEEEDEWEQNFD